jgi:hypothetical protein
VRKRKEDTLAELGRKGREVMEQLEPRGTRAEGGKSEGLERMTKVTIRLPVGFGQDLQAQSHRRGANISGTRGRGDAGIFEAAMNGT